MHSIWRFATAIIYITILTVFLFFLSCIYVTATTLTSWHLIVTFCTLHAAQRFHLFDAKAIDMKTVMLFGILNGVSIGLLNLSLGFNSIGFYQVHLNFTANWDFQIGLPSLSSLLDLHPGGVFLLYIADDQTCNHTIHCPIGNSVPEKAIQVSTTIYTHKHTACIIFKWFFSKFLRGKFIFSTSCSQKIKLSLLVLLGGVAIASVTDLQLNFVGTILSLLAIVTTCVGQIVSFLKLHAPSMFFASNWC